jgi:hypothetical protein
MACASPERPGCPLLASAEPQACRSICGWRAREKAFRRVLLLSPEVACRVFTQFLSKFFRTGIAPPLAGRGGPNQ